MQALIQPPGLTAMRFYITAHRLNLSEVFKVLWTFYMLRLIGAHSVNILPLNPFERSYPVSIAK